eukprot:TRINITY_DN5790_c0_g1_i3.p1 TRINITY_DN5790_c0_g1~~TRINITY_DN5790_c0_g1_i3.p1  ORF type:complete len:396 (-),score=85.77 TRINITY_DN5790_c0_g1_i3:35-1222(-)
MDDLRLKIAPLMEALATAKTAAMNFAEPLGQRFWVLQAQLADIVLRLSAVGPVRSGLEWLLEVNLVQSVAEAALGSRRPPPETLLSALLALLGLVLLWFVLVPKAKLILWSFIYFFVSRDKKPHKPTDIRLDRNGANCRHMKSLGAWAAAEKRAGRAAARGGGAEGAADEDEHSKVLQVGGLRPGSDEQALTARDRDLSVAKAPARQRTIQRKAMEQLREPDTVVSPVAKLRSAVQGYQASRDAKKAVLEEKLSNRPDPLEKLYHHSAAGPHGGSSGSPHADLDLGDVRQGPWYRSLLQHVRQKLDSKTPSKALHLIMDSVKQVLDQGLQFDAEAYFKVLAQIEVGDIVGPVASLLVTMLAGIPGVDPLELPPWFEQRSGEVPPEILEAIAENGQ